jgi:phosphoribosylformimino-5-aminoimidazole carboxamide ribotide isomerase
VKIIPAIDLLEGNAVRLHKGRRDEATVFSHEPWTLIEQFASAGAERIHVVDLDGAFAGARAHTAIVDRILAESPVPIEVGGGIRDRAAIDAVLGRGAQLVVVGTAAVKDPDMVATACRDYPGRIVVAVDARDGVVAIEGWVEAAEVTAIELGQRAAGWGAAALLYTDVARDGAHTGPNVEATARLAAAVGAATPVIASGGVSSLADLAALRDAGLAYVVVGRALYDERFTLAQAIAVGAGGQP